jgi:predicted nucleic acid-binding protein
MGEVVYVISKEEDVEYKEKYFEAFKRLILYHDIEIYRVSKVSLDKLSEVLVADTFFKPMDALVFACALENKSIKFITFDSDFLKSKNLKEKFKEVKIDDKV